MKQISIRRRLDNLYACIEVCMKNLSEQDSFEAFGSVLFVETGALESVLSQLLEQYKTKLPIWSEEPEEVKWRDERDQLRKLISELGMVEKTAASFVVVDDKLNAIADLMDQIDNALIPEDNAEIYAVYSERELKSYYDKGQWSSDQRTLREEILQQPQAHLSAYFAEQRIKWLEKLKELAPYAVDVEKMTIYYEGLGRKLWCVRKERDQFREILKCVKSHEFYCEKLNQEVTFQDREYTEEELKKTEIQTNVNKQKTLQNTFGYAKITCALGQYVQGYDEKWVIKFWEDLAKSKIAGHIANRLNANKQKWKVQCQIIGELKKKGVLVGSDSEIAGAIREQIKSIPCSKETIIDYLRHTFTEEKKLTPKRAKENQEISDWIQAY